MFKGKKKSLSLEEIFDGCLKKRPSAQKQLYERFYGFGNSIALRYASSSDEVQEMMNDGFLKIWIMLILKTWVIMLSKIVFRMV